MKLGSDVSSFEAMPPEERILLERKLLARRKAVPQPTLIPRRESSGPCALSFAQSRLWLVERIIPAPGNYNISRVWRIRGALNAEALRAALDALLVRHEVLRTRLVMCDGAPQQVVVPHQPFALQVLDLGQCDDDARKDSLDEFVRSRTREAFDFSSENMLRAGLARLHDREYVLVVTLHHIAADGWSLGVLDRELEHGYTAFDRGLSAEMPPLPLQYSDFSEWQRDTLRGPVLERLLAYWRHQLSGMSPLDLPTDRARPAQLSDRGDRERFTVPAPIVAILKDQAHTRGATLYMALLAAFQILLMRHSGQDDIAVGSPITGRNRTETEGLIGFFVNSLVMRGDLSGNPTFSELLTRTRERALDAYDHRDLPFEKLVEELKPERDPSRNPLFQAMFTLENARESELRLPGLEITRVRIPVSTAKFDLTLFLAESDGRLEGSFEYSIDLFDASTIKRMAEHFLQLLAGIAADPECHIGELPLLTAAERHQLLAEWNDSAADYPRDRCIQELFQRQVARTPNALALTYGDIQLTYAEINACANRLAHHLRGLGAGPDIPIGICMERSPDMVIAMLGILKADGAYVPLDPDYPKERLAFMLRDTEARVLVTQHALLAQLPEYDGHVVCLDRDAQDLDAHSAADPPTAITPDALAYIIYTSGSTGQPKGVMVPHRGVTRLVRDTDYIELDASDCVAHMSNPSFDAATFEIWGALLNGSRLAVLRREIALDPPRLVTQLRRDRVTALFLTTALFNAIVRFQPDAFAGVKHVLFGGEAVDPRWVRECLAAGAPERLLHVYGPTETVTFATWFQVKCVGTIERTVPIGRPVANVQLAVLDRFRQPVPIGVAGELYIRGDSLARGYWRRAELTAKRFVADPYASRAGASMYRTGDLVRYLFDGNIEFLGRLDQQLKLRGFRVEPGEIESVLRNEAPIREALVVMREDSPGNKELVAYVAGATETVTAIGLRELLKSKLPDYMLPAAFVLLPALPLTPNGKIDRERAACTGEWTRRERVRPCRATRQHRIASGQDLGGPAASPARSACATTSSMSAGTRCWPCNSWTESKRPSIDGCPWIRLWFRGSTIEALARILCDESDVRSRSRACHDEDGFPPAVVRRAHDGWQPFPSTMIWRVTSMPSKPSTDCRRAACMAQGVLIARSKRLPPIASNRCAPCSRMGLISWPDSPAVASSRSRWRSNSSWPGNAWRCLHCSIPTRRRPRKSDRGSANWRPFGVAS